MNLAAFDTYCASLPATRMVVQWGGAHVWKVGDKVFALCAKWGPGNAGDGPKVDAADGDSWRIALKVSDMAFQMLIEEEGIRPSPYLGRFKWVQLDPQSALSDEEIQKYLAAAHTIIARKLTRAQRKEIGLPEIMPKDTVNPFPRAAD